MARSGKHFEIHLLLSRMDLADLIGVQPETMSRLVKKLVDDGRFTISGRKERMLDPASNALPQCSF
ncbi:MAG: helix-turn-helix domain-containing protein [Shimia sp.]|uniref:helix-turn-helix domain-containing protein n=1 Tax=Shimia sp. TaxID=1954381 RepID=UPI004058C472